MKNRDTSTDSKVIASFEITIEKFEDGTCRPKVENKGMAFFEVIGMMELIKLEMAEISWDTADKIRKAGKT